MLTWKSGHAVTIYILLTILVISSGCSSKDIEATADIKWTDLIDQLTDVDRMARLDTLDSKLISSSDPSRQNKDHNHFLRIEKKDGISWIVIADIKGAGYISRFWCTGANTDAQKIRFYFNNERRPRLETTLHDFFGEKKPFLPPLASREQGCWYSYLPIPFSERLIIMIEEIDVLNGQQIRDYHQINYSLVQDNKSVQTFPKKITEEQMNAIEKALLFWKNIPNAPEIKDSSTINKDGVLSATNEISIDTLRGPAVITRLEIKPDFTKLQSPEQREKILRDLVLQITWNGETKPSVNVPIGDFFGSFLRKTSFETLYVGIKDKSFFSNLPMPFEKSANISIRNDGKVSIPLTIRATVRPQSSWDKNMGYLHSAWNKSGPDQKGKPHVMLRTEGRGKYVGCFLSITSKDRSWWALESNDYIYIDDEVSPAWKGTGLEDYFNGGWYYKNAKIRPFAGLLFHAPFKTVQYRFHMTDPVHFNKRIYFEFERGPNHVSRADMASVVYYYLSKPASAPQITLQSEERYEARTELEEHTLMRELNNQDSIGDLQGAYDHIDEYLERYPNYPHKEMLRLRQLAYRETISGFDTVKEEYINVANTSTNIHVVSEVKKLLWFHEDKSHTLLRIYCNAETFPFIDGRPYGRYDHPEMAFSIPIVLAPGKHVFCLKTKKTRTMPWILTHLRTHKGNVIQPYEQWRCSTNYQNGIHSIDFDDSLWPLKRAEMKGPPELPFVRLSPNPYVNMLPNATLVIPGNKGGPDGYIYYRKEFCF